MARINVKSLFVPLFFFFNILPLNIVLVFQPFHEYSFYQCQYNLRASHNSLIAGTFGVNTLRPIISGTKEDNLRLNSLPDRMCIVFNGCFISVWCRLRGAEALAYLTRLAFLKFSDESLDWKPVPPIGTVDLDVVVFRFMPSEGPLVKAIQEIVHEPF